MKLDYTFLADQAAQHSGVVGGIGIGVDTLVAQQLPLTHPQIYVVAQARCSKSERKLHSLVIEVNAPSGQVVDSQESAVDFRVVPANLEGVARMVFGFHSLEIEETGKYTFSITEGGKTLSTVSLLVVATEPTPGNAKKAKKKVATERITSIW